MSSIACEPRGTPIITKKMPLWSIYHPTGTFEDEASREALSKDITKSYTSIGLPPFYVIVNYITLPGNATWIGGRPNTANPFIRIKIDHIAVTLPDEDEAYKRATANIDAALKPHIADRGYDWEYHVDETERRLWKVGGMYAPLFKSDEEKKWFDANKPLPWTGA
ncbi:hypothetical protein D0865_09181 [Hortaea werneckii]|uniref:Tautomerase cis-CaaD-like domain-containing protein n=1 Tax=Hortaea werneckii TaxID=91943 RepID=A0A3M7C3I3_HORWE|nr:hypothetical protein D0865_09181 [Hortaea werneckii]